MRRLQNGAGYMLIDERASGGELHEDDLLGCNHCDKTMTMSSWRQSGGHCMVCDGHLCTRCLGRIPQHGCEHSVKRLTRALGDQYRREQNARVLGI